MMTGTAFMFQYGLNTQSLTYALTLAFTTFVLFQFFNVFNARAEHNSVFNVNFLRNGKLWLALLSVLALQVMVVHWQPAQIIFGTIDLRMEDWLWAVLVASSLLLLDEMRKLAVKLFHLMTKGRP
jgi:Ca2+-transporting ATPase